jgi:hypothetical protein
MTLEKPLLNLDTFYDYVLKNFDHVIKVDNKIKYLDVKGRTIGVIGEHGYWKIKKYNSNNKKIYILNSEGEWEKRKYKGDKIIQFTNSNGTHWEKTN